ncbi:MAG: 1-(5-phosphoribosyl)-5-((5-phosphoribosylamino)methylideneamino)imidazole-4-carboxamide isomerase [Caldiserica bacterium]|nr:1-(5-phosphoribosyl)-5-((5-phosphoribosylamino)methylideneamino)imidazole-4-carboxamide isomerase [Caldisericota bacterium]
MFIIPAIDIWKGKLVRLFQGSYQKPSFYSLTPPQAARRWREKGFKRLHIVDLEGARAGKPVEKELIIEVARQFQGEVEVGGGIRRKEEAEFYLENGISYVILGTKGLEKTFLSSLVEKFPRRIIVSLDLSGKKIKVEGWEKEAEESLPEILSFLSSLPLQALIVTDIKRDGTMKGISGQTFLEVVKHTSLPLIVGGGISSLQDINWIRENLPGIKGVIVGKAMYEGNLLKEIKGNG